MFSMFNCYKLIYKKKYYLKNLDLEYEGQDLNAGPTQAL